MEKSTITNWQILSSTSIFRRQCSDKRRGSTHWDKRVASNVDEGGPTLWPMEGSGLGLRRTHLRGGRSNYSTFPIIQTRGAATKEGYRWCPRRVRHVPDSRSYTLCSQDTGAYLRAAPYDMARVQRRSTSAQGSPQDCSNVRGELREAR